jgi:hypothetical protein
MSRSLPRPRPLPARMCTQPFRRSASPRRRPNTSLGRMPVSRMSSNRNRSYGSTSSTTSRAPLSASTSSGYSHPRRGSEEGREWQASRIVSSAHRWRTACFSSCRSADMPGLRLSGASVSGKRDRNQRWSCSTVTRSKRRPPSSDWASAGPAATRPTTRPLVPLRGETKSACDLMPAAGHQHGVDGLTDGRDLVRRAGHDSLPGRGRAPHVRGWSTLRGRSLSR